MRPIDRLLTIPVVALCVLASRPMSAQQAPTTEPGRVPEEMRIVAFAPEARVDLARSSRMASGVYRRDLRVGRGDSVATLATLSLRMRVQRPDGVVLRQDSTPQSLRWLPGTFLPAVEQGLRGMRAGGRRQLVVPSALTGEARRPGGTASTPLVIEVELLSVG